MNKQRRKAIESLIGRIDAVKEMIDGIKLDLETVQSEEQDAYDAMPESLQNGEKGERAQEAIDALQEATDELENIEFDTATDALNRASE